MESTTGSTGDALTVKEFAEATRLTRQYLHTLPADLQPERVRFGRKILIIESPATWLRRIQAAGGAPSRRVAA